MYKADSLSRYSGEAKSRMYTDFLDERQLMDYNNNNIREEKDIEDVELEGIDVARWEKKNRV